MHHANYEPARAARGQLYIQMAEVAVPRQMFQEILMLYRPTAGAARTSMTGKWDRIRQAETAVV